MIKTFTKDDLVRYIYQETTKEENKLIHVLLNTDADLQEKYLELLEVKKDIDGLSEIPSSKVIQRVLNFSKDYNLHSV